MRRAVERRWTAATTTRPSRRWYHGSPRSAIRSQNPTAATTQPEKRGRGRPKGSTKNKTPGGERTDPSGAEPRSDGSVPVKRGPGRPKGKTAAAGPGYLSSPGANNVEPGFRVHRSVGARRAAGGSIVRHPTRPGDRRGRESGEATEGSAEGVQAESSAQEDAAPATDDDFAGG